MLMNPTCPQCGSPFTYRANKMFCSANCRKRHSEQTANLGSMRPLACHKTVREGLERRATQEFIYDQVFKTEPSHRADVLLGFLIYAAVSRTKSYSDLFTYPNAQRSSRFTARDRGTIGLHYQGRPSVYPVTLAAMANYVCKYHLGITSRQFIDEIRRDKVTMANMQEVYDQLMDRTKTQPVIQGCNIETPAYPRGVLKELTASQIAHAKMLLA